MEYPVEAKNVMSNFEVEFYALVKKAFPKLDVFVQVQLSRFILVKKGNDFDYWWKKYSLMTVDYLICNKGEVLFAIELDDTTHELPNRIISDKKKNKIFENAGIRLHRFHVNEMPKVKTLKSLSA